MSEQIKHECGIALLRLLKPLEYYVARYNSTMYGIDKISLLLEKQHNRGQDGAGLMCLKLDMPPGEQYLYLKKSNSISPIIDIFNYIKENNKKVGVNPKKTLDVNYLKHNLDFVGEIFLGHLRYGTFGKNNIDYVHPVVRTSNWRVKTLAIAGNFNLTNVQELFDKLVQYGEHPVGKSDTITILEKIGFYLDQEYDKLFFSYSENEKNQININNYISEKIDLVSILRNSAKSWDGGYVIAGVLGNGDLFILRDPAGIRPAFYYYDDEIFVAASERPAIQTAFNIPLNKIKEVEPAKTIIIKKNGEFIEKYFAEPQTKKSCSFERIYFSRGTDASIYNERKMLGQKLCPRILELINYDFKNTVFSFIPNTAIVAFLGLREALFNYLNEYKRQKAIEYKNNLIDEKEFHEVFNIQPRIETIAVKDIKLRTFITQDSDRNDLVTHIYDVTYGVIRDGIDTLVVLDDSIVRGTTLKYSIIRILDRLNPKRIIVASSAPQIRYPDCYGIDMSKISDFIAFKAAIELLYETKQANIINEVYARCVAQKNEPAEKMKNYVKMIYEPFTEEEISKKISKMLKADDVKADVDIIFQKIEDLHAACPNHLGDWYFTGEYPTPGGYKVLNQAFINFIEGRNERAYGLEVPPISS